MLEIKQGSRPLERCEGALVMMDKWIIILFLIFFKTGFAQLSPGELHRSHARLEGLKNCTRCHEVGQQVSAQKCLECHTLLNERIRQSRGLHANQEYRQCEKCHVEHHGRDFDLIWWENGKDNFNHQKTGYTLKGKHAGLKCNECHRAEFITTKETLKKQKKDLNRTFLGLQKNCVSCHRDEHRGQLAESCLNCHTMEGWKPASGFDHGKAQFPLTGKHQAVACEKCHPTVEEQQILTDNRYIKFTGIEFSTCTNCHRDVHNNKFGRDCVRCHNTSGWQNYSKTKFSHDRTRFPLQGKHADLKCQECHLPGKPLTGLQFQHCRDCHRDYHQGQFSRRPQKGACEECHTVNGFIPATFSIFQHNNTHFPLKGAHLAVPCIACHEKTYPGAAGPTTRFRFASTRCGRCHKDPHEGQVNKYMKNGGCENCHTVQNWRDVHFDHNQTEFALVGKHNTVSCRECHSSGSPTGSRLKFIENSTQCVDCHEDPHQGQFAQLQTDINRQASCGRCHTSRDWLAEKFDHNRDASFKLEGAHRFVKCRDCHPTEMEDNKVFVRYKPLDTACRACHGEIKTQETLKK